MVVKQVAQEAQFVFPWFQVISTMVLMSLSGVFGYMLKAQGVSGLIADVQSMKTDIQNLKTQVQAGVASVKA